MARTNPGSVMGIIEVEEGIDLWPFINFASKLVDRACTGDRGPSVPYENDHLELIETWLAAHFYTNRDPRSEQSKLGEAMEKFQSKVDLGLFTSHYGQTAMVLDDNGGLAQLNREMARKAAVAEGLVPSVNWLGTETQ